MLRSGRLLARAAGKLLASQGPGVASCMPTAVSAQLAAAALRNTERTAPLWSLASRWLATETAQQEGKQQGKQEAAPAGEGGAAAEGGASAEGSSSQEQPDLPSVEELLDQIKEKEGKVEALAAQVEGLTDAVKRSLAEMENVRQRTAREVSNAKKYGVQGFVKSMLDVADNLERAVASVKPEEVETADNERVRKLLKGLLEGISGTDRILMSVLKAEGVERFDPMGQKFDPSQHNALFEFEDASKEPGTVGAVTKRGYMIHDRVLRAADVGVVKAPAP